MTGLTIGVDLGKTSCRAVVFAEGDRELARASGAGFSGLAEPDGAEGAFATITATLDQALRDFVVTHPEAVPVDVRPPSVGSAFVGAAGAESSPAATVLLAQLLARQWGASTVGVASDSLTCHAGALAGAPGVVLTAGTGAVALGVGAGGALHRVDGWGQWLGDEGSGAWIGREALRAAVRAHDGRGPATAQITQAALLAERPLAAGGRILYVGAGTPGRLAALDAAECPPTYGTAPEQVVALLAGGSVAGIRAVEGAEDDAHAGARDLAALRPGPDDVVIAISASGRTPYVLSALAAGAAAGAATVAVVNNAGSPAGRSAQVIVELLTGAEVVSGSTRLTAGTAQKVTLNAISTTAMVRLGKTYGARMVDVVASNEKLRRRAVRIVREVTGVDDASATPAPRRCSRPAVGVPSPPSSPCSPMSRCPRRPSVSRPRAAVYARRWQPGDGRVIVVAVASGTSVDSVDVAVVEVERDGEVGVTLRPVHLSERPWPHELRARLLALLPPATTTARELALLDTAIGQVVAEVAATAVLEAGVTADLIVSPGQTVHHEVVGGRCQATLQLGQPAWVAERTGVPVVSDLRASDVAAGGHGAPLASTFDALWLTPGQAALNLGGIANLTVRRAADVVAFDTGPANCLLDLVAARATPGPGYDVDGRLAAAGSVRPDLLASMLGDPYFALPAPKSTGREHLRMPDPASSPVRRLRLDCRVTNDSSGTARVPAWMR